MGGGGERGEKDPREREGRLREREGREREREGREREREGDW